MGPKWNSQQSPGSPKEQPARGTPQPPDKIGPIVKSTRCFVLRPVKNGAPLPIWRSRRRARQPGSANVRSGRRACCNRLQSARSTAKWRFCPSKKRHLAPFSATFSSIFPVFFQLAFSEWRFGREFDLEMARAMVDRHDQSKSATKRLHSRTQHQLRNKARHRHAAIRAGLTIDWARIRRISSLDQRPALFAAAHRPS